MQSCEKYVLFLFIWKYARKPNKQSKLVNISMNIPKQIQILLWIFEQLFTHKLVNFLILTLFLKFEIGKWGQINIGSFEGSKFCIIKSQG